MAVADGHRRAWQPAERDAAGHGRAVLQITAISQVVTNLHDPLSVGAYAGALWARGWPATVQPGHGVGGPVTVLYVAISRRQEAALHRDVTDLAPEAFWSSEELRSLPRGSDLVAA